MAKSAKTSRVQQVPSIAEPAQVDSRWADSRLSHAWIILPLLIAALGICPLLPAGIPPTSDGPLHLLRTVELDQLIRVGVLYPRWALDLAFGYGYPLFNYYAPLFYYVAEIPHLLGANFDVAFKLAIYLAWVIYGVATYWWTRPLLGPAPAAVAAVAYLTIPFRFYEAYMQGDYPQFFALALAPVALGALHRILTSERVSYLHVVLLVGSIAAVVLDHNISALWLAPLLVAYGLALAIGMAIDTGRTNWIRVVGSRLAIAGGLGILAMGISAFFWLPALVEQNLVQLYRLRTDDFNVQNSFINLSTLLAPPRVFDQSAANPPPFLHLGWGQLALALLTIPLVLVFLRELPRRRVPAPDAWPLNRPSPATLLTHLGFGWALLIASAALTLPVSLPIWQAIPLLDYTEYPWRVLELSGLATALLAGLAVHLLLALLHRRGARYALAALAVAAAVATLVVPSLVYLYPRTPTVMSGPLSAASVTNFERAGGAVGTTSAGEYYPIDVTTHPTASLPANLATVGRLDRASVPADAQVHFQGSSGYAERYTISLPRPATLRFDLINFAGWQVRIDGAVVATQASPGEGLLLVDVPAGSHQLVLDFVDTPVRQLGWLIAGLSVLVLVCIGLVLVWARRGRRRGIAVPRPSGDRETISRFPTDAEAPPLWSPRGRGDSEASPVQGGRRARLPSPGNPDFPPRPRGGRGWGYSLVASAGLALLILILRVTSPAPYAAMFARRSPPDQVYGVSHPLSVRLEDKVELVGYDLETSSVPPGGQMHVTFYWRALRPLSADYRSLAMIARVGDKSLVSQDDRGSPGGIPTHAWRTDQFTIDEHTIALPANLSPMVYQLQIALYDRKTLAHLQEDGVNGWPGQQIDLQQIHVTRPTPIDPTTLRSGDNAVFGRGIALQGYQIKATRLQPGQTLDLTFVWRAQHPLDRNYTVFTHLVDANQKQVAGQDSMPMDGQFPTSTWLVGEDIVDLHPIVLPPTLPPGQYHLAFGWYDAATMQRLDATGSNWHGTKNQVDLDNLPITVEAPQ